MTAVRIHARESKITTGQHITVAEYLKLDDNSEFRQEYHDGTLRTMSGGTRVHNTIILNIASHLRPKADEKNCWVFAEGMRFQVSETRFFYPDVMVSCEDADQHDRTVLKACFVAEVLSDSTIANDFGSKLFTYMAHPHLQTIAYILQTERKIYLYQRDNEGWSQEIVENEIRIPCLEAVLTLEQIYQRVNITPST